MWHECAILAVPMAGQPIERTFEQAVESDGGETYMLDRIVSGDSNGDIAKDYDVSRAMVIRYFRKKGPERLRRYLEARALSAVAHIEVADEILSDADETQSASVQKAKHRADLRQLMAKSYDRETFGTAIEVNQTIDVGSQLLAVLRQYGRPALPGQAVPDAVFEAIDETATLAGEGQEATGQLPKGQEARASVAVTHHPRVPQSALQDVAVDDLI
jgi:hypothetical protein